MRKFIKRLFIVVGVLLGILVLAITAVVIWNKVETKKDMKIIAEAK